MEGSEGLYLVPFLLQPLYVARQLFLLLLHYEMVYITSKSLQYMSVRKNYYKKYYKIDCCDVVNRRVADTYSHSVGPQTALFYGNSRDHIYQLYLGPYGRCKHIIVLTLKVLGGGQ